LENIVGKKRKPAGFFPPKEGVGKTNQIEQSKKAKRGLLSVFVRNFCFCSRHQKLEQQNIFPAEAVSCLNASRAVNSPDGFFFIKVN